MRLSKHIGLFMWPLGDVNNSGRERGGGEIFLDGKNCHASPRKHGRFHGPNSNVQRIFMAHPNCAVMPWY